MGAIGQWAKNQASKAYDSVQNMGDKFQTSIGKVQGYLGTAFETAKNGAAFVGLQYSAIPTIRASIGTYVSKVQTEIAKLNTDASNSNALKGEVASAANQYVKAVSDVASAYVSSLLAYSDRMFEYGEEYKKADTELASTVAEEATGMTNDAQVYTEKY